MNPGVLSEEVKTCPLCGGSSSAPFDQRSLHGYAIHNRLCQGCGLVFQSPRLAEAELTKFYEAEYRLLYQGRADPTAKDLFVQAGRAAALIDFLHAQAAAQRFGLPDEPRALDIGCSAGLLLQRYRSDFGAQVAGVEPGEAYRAYTQQQGLEVQPSLEALTSRGFDLISMMHVLEHLPHPVAYLQTLRAEYLKPAGWLVIEVPNLYAHDCFEVAHLTSFSAHTLRQVLQQAGFQVAALLAHGRPRSRLLPLYLTALARPAVEGRASSVERKIEPESNVVLKRRLGLLRRRLLERVAPGMAWLPLPKS
jgi:SAM-dependent methyltransferase